MEFKSTFNDSLEMWPDGAGQLTQEGADLHKGKIYHKQKYEPIHCLTFMLNFIYIPITDLVKFSVRIFWYS